MKIGLTNMIAWNAFACDYDQGKVLAQAQAMVDSGLVEAGYNSMILDDCFTLKDRDADGKLVEGVPHCPIARSFC